MHTRKYGKYEIFHRVKLSIKIEETHGRIVNSLKDWTTCSAKLYNPKTFV